MLHSAPATAIDKKFVKKGETIVFEFISGNPSTGYRTDDTYVSIEYKQAKQWKPLLSDMAWSTTIRWEKLDDNLIAKVSWAVPKNLASGDYRIKHLGNYRLTKDEFKQFESVPAEFKVDD